MIRTALWPVLLLVAALWNAGFVRGADFLPPPINDDFQSSSVLGITSGTFTGYTFSATNEPAEPNHAGVIGGRSVWWTWKAPAQGSLRIQVRRDKGDGAPVIAIYTGVSLGSLRSVGSEPNNPKAATVEMRTDVQAGVDYRIAVDGIDKGELTFVLDLDFRATPPNDSFAAAVAFPSDAAETQWNSHNFGATSERGEPAHDGDTARRSLWWRWTSPSDGSVQVQISRSLQTGAPVLAIYRGSDFANLELVAGDTNLIGSNFARTRFDTVRGVDYYIAVDGRRGGQFDFRGALISTPRSRNDLFANRIQFVGNTNTLRGHNFGAGREPGEPDHEDGPSGRSVWWSWTPATDGTVGFTVGQQFTPLEFEQPSPARAVLAVYEGNSVENLTPVFRSRPGWVGGEVSPGRFPVVGGKTYSIAMAGTNGGSLAVFADLRWIGYPANDDFANRTVLPLTSDVAFGHNYGATSEINEPNHADAAPNRSIWYSFIPPEFGTFEVTLQSTAPAIASVYRGTSLENLSSIAVQTNASQSTTLRFSFEVGQGDAYHFALDSRGANSFESQFRYLFTPSPTNNLFSRRITIPATTNTIAGSTLGADLEPGEPAHGLTEGGRSVWWAWRAPVTGSAEFNVSASARTPQGIPMASLYLGTDLASLQRIDNLTTAGQPLRIRRRIDIISGLEYILAVDSVGGIPMAHTVEVSSVPTPDNDAFAQRLLLPSGSFLTTGYTYGATIEPGEPSHGPGQMPSHRSVWYAWRASGDGVLSVYGTVGQLDDTPRLGFFIGDVLESLVPIRGGRIINRTEPIAQQFHVKSGVTYQLSLDSPTVVPQEARGHSFSLRADYTSVPTNNAFAQRTVLIGPTVSATGYNNGCDTEPGEPVHTATGGGATIWYQWTPPEDGSAEITVAGQPPLSPVFAVYSGTALTHLVPLVRVDNNERATSVTRLLNVTGNTTYHIVLDGYRGQEMIFNLSLSLSPTPANDLYRNRIPLAKGTNAHIGYTFGATREPGEPVHLGATNGHSVWFTLSPPAEVSQAISIQSTKGAAPGFAIYSGETLETLRLVHQFTNPQQLPGISDRFFLPGGQRYQLALDSSSNGEYYYNLSTSYIVREPHDAFARAIIWDGVSRNYLTHTYAASREPGEGNHGGIEGGRSLWWKWQAPTNGSLLVRAIGRDVARPAFALYSGTNLADLKLVAGMTNSQRLSLLERRISVSGGIPLALAMDLENAQEALAEVSLEFTPTPTNDHFRNATLLPGLTNLINGVNYSTSAETDEPTHGRTLGGRSLWWRWTAPTNGSLRLEASMISGIAPLIGVYVGESLGTLQTVADIRNIGFLSRFSTRLDVRGGISYWIALDSAAGAESSFQFLTEFIAKPANDDFANRQRFGFRRNSFTSHNFGATAETNEPDHTGRTARRSVWWSWVAPANGTVEFLLETSESTFLPRLAIYSGTNLSSLTLVAGLTNSTGATRLQQRFSCIEGTEYNFAADGQDGGQMTMKASLILNLPPPNDLFVQRLQLSGLHPQVDGNTFNSSAEPSEPAHEGLAPSRTVWWRWTAPRNGSAVLKIRGDPVTHAISVYTGSGFPSLRRVAGAVFRGTNGGFEFTAVANTEYQIAVSGVNGAESEFSLDLLLSNTIGARLLPVERSDNGLWLSWEIVPGSTVEVQASNDLRTWIPLQLEIPAGPNPRVLVPFNPGEPHLYYRLATY